VTNANYQRKTVLITGASGGIGLELAKAFSTARWNLILTARSRSALESVAAGCVARDGVQADAIQCDLSDPAGPRALLEEIDRRQLTVDGLINNAGFGDVGPFIDEDDFTVLGMIQVNVTALTHLTHVLAPRMVKKGFGRIMNVASVAGFLPAPNMAIYFATKAYVVSFSLALSSELEGTGVTVTAYCPGPTKTGFRKRSTGSEGGKSSFNQMSAETVARIGYEAMTDGKRLVVPGLMNKLSVAAVRFAPRSLLLMGAKRATSSLKAD